jgi:hypothetical protein
MAVRINDDSMSVGIRLVTWKMAERPGRIVVSSNFSSLQSRRNRIAAARNAVQKS